jgi:hypothetical protein
MNTVYVVQEHKYDVSEAKEYGEIVYLLGPKTKPYKSEPIIKRLHECLCDYTTADYLLLIGNPCLIGWTVAVAAQHNEGVVNLLQWSNAEDRYILINSNV